MLSITHSYPLGPTTPPTQVFRKWFPQYQQLLASSACVSLPNGMHRPSPRRARSAGGLMQLGATPHQWGINNQHPPLSVGYSWGCCTYFFWSIPEGLSPCAHSGHQIAFIDLPPLSVSPSNSITLLPGILFQINFWHPNSCLSLEAVVLKEHKLRHQTFHSQFVLSYISVSKAEIFKSTWHRTPQKSRVIVSALSLPFGEATQSCMTLLGKTV